VCGYTTILTASIFGCSAQCDRISAGFEDTAQCAQVQDRVIRLEEKLRLALLMNDSQKQYINQITERQFVALRFAQMAKWRASPNAP